MSPDKFDDVQGRWRMIHDTYQEGYRTGTMMGFLLGLAVCFTLGLIVYGIKTACGGAL